MEVGACWLMPPEIHRLPFLFLLCDLIIIWMSSKYIQVCKSVWGVLNLLYSGSNHPLPKILFHHHCHSRLELLGKILLLDWSSVSWLVRRYDATEKGLEKLSSDFRVERILFYKRVKLRKELLADQDNLPQCNIIFHFKWNNYWMKFDHFPP